MLGLNLDTDPMLDYGTFLVIYTFSLSLWPKHRLCGTHQVNEEPNTLLPGPADPTTVLGSCDGDAGERGWDAQNQG